MLIYFVTIVGLLVENCYLGKTFFFCDFCLNFNFFKSYRELFLLSTDLFCFRHLLSDFFVFIVVGFYLLPYYLLFHFQGFYLFLNLCGVISLVLFLLFSFS